MTPHRDPLAAALARTEAAEARATAAEAALARATERAATPARRWAVPAHATAVLPLPGAAWIMEAVAFVSHGVTPAVLRGSLVCAVASLMWALAFVRRVPVDGGGR